MRMQKIEVEKSENKPSIFLKIADGESVTGVFRGEIFEFYKKWQNGKGIITSEDDPEAKRRFKLNFITKENDKLTAKIWEFGVVIYNQLADINEEYPLEETKVKIKRSGEGTDTTYTILPLTREPIGPAAMKDIQRVPLNILEHREQL